MLLQYAGGRLPLVPCRALVMTFSPPSQFRAISLLSSLCWVVALLWAAWVFADLFWRFAAPQPVVAIPRHESDPRKALAAITAVSAPRQRFLPSAAQTQASAYRVVGLATGFGTLPGFALLRAPDGSVVALAVGEALPDGQTVERIEADAVWLSGARLPAPAVPLARNAPQEPTDSD